MQDPTVIQKIKGALKKGYNQDQIEESLTKSGINPNEYKQQISSQKTKKEQKQPGQKKLIIIAILTLILISGAIYLFTKIEFNEKTEYPFKNLQEGELKSYLSQGLEFYNQNQLEQAQEQFQKAIEIDPSQELAFQFLGLTQIYLREYDSALENFNKALKINPKNDIAQANIGLIYLVSGDLEKADIEIKKALTINPKSEHGLYTQAGIYFIKEDFDQTEQQFLKVLKVNSKNHNAIRGLGWVYYNTKQYENAETQFNEAIQLNPTDSQAYSGLGWILLDKEEYQLAKEKFQIAIGLYPLNWQSHLGLAEILLIEDYSSNDALQKFNEAEEIIVHENSLTDSWIIKINTIKARIYLDHNERDVAEQIITGLENKELKAPIEQSREYCRVLLAKSELNYSRFKIESPRTEYIDSSKELLEQVEKNYPDCYGLESLKQKIEE